MKINWEQFVKTLSGEFIKNSQLITEGRIRHIFADGIQMCVDRLEAEKSYFDAAMRLNSSKPALQRGEKNTPHADLYCREGQTDYVFEFKYGIGTNHTEMAGFAFNDLNRLSVVDVDKKFFVYVFNDNVAKYYNSTRCGGVFNIDKAKSFYKIGTSFPTESTASFIGKAFSSFANSELSFSDFSYTIEKVIAEKIPNSNLHIIVYEVKQ